jgi:hypothetical protein
MPAPNAAPDAPPIIPPLAVLLILLQPAITINALNSTDTIDFFIVFLILD